MTIQYLARPQVAALVGVSADTLNRYRLPEPDAQIGDRQVGWLPETIERWDAVRGGRGWTLRQPSDPRYVSRDELAAAEAELRGPTAD
ncbi:helix-turn-helix transcriptional regulator [Isoptericola dokdonensis]|uniref:Prophage CP4-57 regulatory protein (AlpA) n=1 Tax=Isoptericola dokdonensis DS-3 TaxID=1300344 RepID=A0A161I1Y6_9MICO|nr:hypothetical protein [Isoptericola dokdonensis]ANC31415.1 hypothetical protein I598_1867 [Isoptericola dokdonensis DS-3]